MAVGDNGVTLVCATNGIKLKRRTPRWAKTEWSRASANRALRLKF